MRLPLIKPLYPQRVVCDRGEVAYILIDKLYLVSVHIFFMNLRQWMDRDGVTVPDLQGRIGVGSRNTVYRYLRGEQIPEPKIMRRIVAETGGAVTPNDFYEIAAEASAAAIR